MPLPHVLTAIAAMAAAIALTRALPFWLFGRGNRPSPTVLYLGRALPPAIMALLVIYCLKDVHPLAYPYGAPEAIALIAVAALHLWRRNALLSIFGGTALYMLLVQAVF
ncbi:MAG: branched-chain amino acid transporter AzlD [Clostridiales bacterium]|nr:branched-chain amino acid transporter AzlD [Clostridiales bacterium]